MSAIGQSSSQRLTLTTFYINSVPKEEAWVKFSMNNSDGIKKAMKKNLITGIMKIYFYSSIRPEKCMMII